MYDLKEQIAQMDKKHEIGKGTIKLLKDKLMMEELTNKELKEKVKNLEQLVHRAEQANEEQSERIESLEEDIDGLNEDLNESMSRYEQTTKISIQYKTDKVRSEKLLEATKQKFEKESNQQKKVIAEYQAKVKKQDDRIKKMNVQYDQLQGKIGSLNRQSTRKHVDKMVDTCDLDHGKKMMNKRVGTEVQKTSSQGVQTQAQTKRTSNQSVQAKSQMTNQSVQVQPAEVSPIASPIKAELIPELLLPNITKNTSLYKQPANINLDDIIFTIQCQLDDVQSTVNIVRQSQSQSRRYSSYLTQ